VLQNGAMNGALNIVRDKFMAMFRYTGVQSGTNSKKEMEV